MLHRVNYCAALGPSGATRAGYCAGNARPQVTPTANEQQREPEGEPQIPPIRVPRAWEKLEGRIVVVGGFSNAGKSSLVEAVATAFGSKRWYKHPNKRVWISNESGQESNSMRHLLRYTNDSFPIGATSDIDHGAMSQSILSMTSKFKHVVTCVEGHKIFENEDLIDQAAVLVWIHTPRQVRKQRSPASKQKCPEQWASQMSSEAEYFGKIKPIFRRYPITVLNGLQSRAFNAITIMGIMGLYSPTIPRRQLPCYREFEVPDPQDEDADERLATNHIPHERSKFNEIFRSKLCSISQT